MTMRLAVLLCGDQEVHDLAECWLTAARMAVISTSAAQDAERQILEQRVELLILDELPIYVPGLSSLRKLKDQSPHLHVILIPRGEARPDVSVARISGVDAVLVRPVSKASLLSVVAELRNLTASSAVAH